MLRSREFFLALILISCPYLIYSQHIDSTSFSIVSRQSFYTSENKGEILILVPPGLTGKIISVNLKIGKETAGEWNSLKTKAIIRLPFLLKLNPADYKVEATIRTGTITGIRYIAKTKLSVLVYKSNEVKTDRLTGGLIVNRLPFFPFGFYCYSPVYPTLPEEEVVKGFNVISPYQKIISETVEDRKAYMDRCAELGMKVHYNLLSVSGGGGVGSKIDGLSDSEKKERLIAEIKLFRDHPALLGWYISDEPNGKTITSGQLEDIYKTVKENDPWHPVSIVFMAPLYNCNKIPRCA